MKIRARRNKPKFRVIYEYVSTPDGEKRLTEACGMLFDEIEKMIVEENLSKKNIKKENIISIDKK